MISVDSAPNGTDSLKFFKRCRSKAPLSYACRYGTKACLVRGRFFQSLFRDPFDLYNEFHFIADDNTTRFDRFVPVQTEIFAIDFTVQDKP